jgi:hypothetical protein
MTEKQNKSVKTKIDGGILLYAIFITFIVAVFSGILILLFSYLNKNAKDYFIYNQMEDEVKSAIQYSLSSESNMKYFMAKKFQIYNDAPFKTIVNRYPWGVYDIIHAFSYHKFDSIEITALAGSAKRYTESIALNITNAQNGLKVSGKTIIEGEIILPNTAVKKVNIEGRSFENINQRFNISKQNYNNLPPINKNIFQPLKYLQKDYIKEQFYSLDYITSSDSIVNSFTKTPIIIYHSGKINLENKTLIGNIILVSDDEVFLDGSCKIKNIIVVGRKIHVSNLKNSQMQCFAEQSIILDNVSLDYPSAIVLKDSINRMDNKLSVLGNSNIRGTIIHITKPSVKSRIHISRESQVEGIVYSSSFVELKKNLHGSLICYSLFFETKQNTYENLLVDSKIDINKRSNLFIEPNIFSNNNDKEIIKWLN